MYGINDKNAKLNLIRAYQRVIPGAFFSRKASRTLNVRRCSFYVYGARYKVSAINMAWPGFYSFLFERRMAWGARDNLGRVVHHICTNFYLLI